MITKIKVFFYMIFKSKNIIIMICPYCKGVHFRKISHKYNFDEKYKEGSDDKFVDTFVCERCDSLATVSELWSNRRK